MPEIITESPERTHRPKMPDLLKIIGHTAIYTYDYVVYAYDQWPRGGRPEIPLFGQIEQELVHSPQPLYPSVPTTVKDIQEALSSRTVTMPEPLSLFDRFTQATWMSQFTDRLTNRDPTFFEYSEMVEIKDRCVALTEQQGHPLTFAQQLNVGLELTNNDIAEALTKLWFTSRQYARWLDTASISGLPDLTTEEIITQMKEWRSTLMACKNADAENYQDAPGDNYFLWMFARARVMNGTQKTMPRLIGKLILEHATSIDSRRIIKQSIPSNHRKAAAIGNAIGDTILNIASDN